MRLIPQISSVLCFYSPLCFNGALLMAQQVKSLSAVQETQEPRVQSLGQKDPLVDEMATHSSTLARRIPWTKTLAGYSS